MPIKKYAKLFIAIDLNIVEFRNGPRINYEDVLCESGNKRLKWIKSYKLSVKYFDTICEMILYRF